MPEILDSFPAPALDSNKWNETLSPGVSLTVDNRVEPVTIDALGKSVFIDSSEKFSVPGATSFDVSIRYSDIQWVDDISLVHFLTWQTYRKDEHNEPWAGIRIAVISKWDSAIFLDRLSWVNGLQQREQLDQDDSVISGGLRITREGLIYTIHYLVNEVWVALESLDLKSQEPGFITFGQYAEDLELNEPWIGNS